MTRPTPPSAPPPRRPVPATPDKKHKPVIVNKGNKPALPPKPAKKADSSSKPVRRPTPPPKPANTELNLMRAELKDTRALIESDVAPEISHLSDALQNLYEELVLDFNFIETTKFSELKDFEKKAREIIGKAKLLNERAKFEQENKKAEFEQQKSQANFRSKLPKLPLKLQIPNNKRKRSLSDSSQQSQSVFYPVDIENSSPPPSPKSKTKASNTEPKQESLSPQYQSTFGGFTSYIDSRSSDQSSESDSSITPPPSPTSKKRLPLFQKKSKQSAVPDPLSQTILQNAGITGKRGLDKKLTDATTSDNPLQMLLNTIISAKEKDIKEKHLTVLTKVAEHIDLLALNAAKKSDKPLLNEKLTTIFKQRQDALGPNDQNRKQVVSNVDILAAAIKARIDAIDVEAEKGKSVSEYSTPRGMFRKEGTAADVLKLEVRGYSSPLDQLVQEVSGDNILESTFKRMLRHDSPLTMSRAKELAKLQQRYMEAHNGKTEGIELDREFRNSVLKLYQNSTETQQQLLRYCSEFMQLLDEKKEATAMPAENIGICFGPSMISADNEMEKLKFIAIGNKVASNLLITLNSLRNAGSIH